MVICRGRGRKSGSEKAFDFVEKYVTTTSEGNVQISNEFDSVRNTSKLTYRRMR